MDFFWKAKKKAQDSPLDSETHLYVREDLANERLIDADFNQLVSLPPSLDSREWIATHTVGFVEHINLLYGTILEFCTSSQCPAMTVTTGTLQWTDDKGKKSKCTAVEYCDYSIMFCQKCVADETLFPTKYGNKFPAHFDSLIRRIYRLLCHMISHLYHSHYRHLVTLGLNGSLNTVTYHLALFLRVYNICPNISTTSIASTGTNVSIEDRELAFILLLSERLHKPMINCDVSATETAKPTRETTPIVPVVGEEFQERGIDIAEVPAGTRKTTKTSTNEGTEVPAGTRKTTKTSTSEGTGVKNGSVSISKSVPGTAKPEMGRLRQAMAGLTSRKENVAN